MSEKNAIKIIVDTNIWISFLIGHSLDPLVHAIKSKNVIICFSKGLHDELFTVMTRPKLSSIISEEKIAEIREIVHNYVTMIIPNIVITDCRDPKDNFLLELAVSAEADYIITGDKDLLVLNPYKNINIVSANDFEKILLALHKITDTTKK